MNKNKKPQIKKIKDIFLYNYKHRKKIQNSIIK